MSSGAALRHHWRMLRVLPALLLLALTVIALIDCLSRSEDDIRGLPRIIWAFLIVLIPLLGPTGWFLFGRAGSATSGSSRRAGGRSPWAGRPRPLAPDDDPEFLRRLGDQRRTGEDEMLRRWEEDLRQPDDEPRRRDTRGDDQPTDDQHGA
jgi:hypothetical protein